jgi:hypothetical protein
MTAAGAPRFLRRVQHDDAGMGIILVVGVATVVLLLSVVAVSAATSALRFSTQHVNYEQAIHVAEHGIDQTFAQLQANRLYSTTTETPPAGLTPQQEREWARAQLQSAPAQREPQGDFAIVKPARRNVIYAAGWVPSRDEARHSRVIKVEYLFSTYSPTKAVLTGGDLVISGNAEIGGVGGSVHAIGNLQISGNPTIGGDATSSGTYTVSGNPTIGGSSGGSRPPEELPRVEPAQLYEQLSAQFAAAWHDLCPDGTVRRPGPVPCTGSVLANTSSGPAYAGWKLSGSIWDKDNAVVDGVFYIHEGSAKIAGNPGEPDSPWRTTIIAAGKASGSGCEQDYGDIEVSGNPVASPYIPGLMLVSGRDLKVNGNPAQSFEGLFAAGEQVHVSGNPNLNGAVIAQDRCDTASSNIHINSVSGNMTLTHNGNLEAPIDSLIRTTLWLEL